MLVLLALWVAPGAAQARSTCYPPPCAVPANGPAAEAQSSSLPVPVDAEDGVAGRAAAAPYVAAGMSMIFGTLLVITSLRRADMARRRRPLERPAVRLEVDRRVQSTVASAPAERI